MELCLSLQRCSESRCIRATCPREVNLSWSCRLNWGSPSGRLGVCHPGTSSTGHSWCWEHSPAWDSLDCPAPQCKRADQLRDALVCWETPIAPPEVSLGCRPSAWKSCYFHEFACGRVRCCIRPPPGRAELLGPASINSKDLETGTPDLCLPLCAHCHLTGHRAAFPPPCAPQQPHGRARYLMAPTPAAVHGAAGLSPSCILIARAIRWQQLPCHQRPAPHAVQAFAKTGLGPGPSPAAHSPRAPAPAPRAGQITPGWGKRCGTAERGLQGEKRGKVPK